MIAVIKVAGVAFFSTLPSWCYRWLSFFSLLAEGRGNHKEEEQPDMQLHRGNGLPALICSSKKRTEDFSFMRLFFRSLIFESTIAKAFEAPARHRSHVIPDGADVKFFDPSGRPRFTPLPFVSSCEPSPLTCYCAGRETECSCLW